MRSRTFFQMALILVILACPSLTWGGTLGERIPAEGAGETPRRTPPIEVRTIGSHLAIVRIAGISSVVLAGPDGVLVVDPGLEEAGPYLKKEIENLGWGEVRTIVDTHWHFDHAGGNKVFGEEATIVSAKATREWLSSDERILGMDQPAYPAFARPEVVADPSESITGYSDDVTVTAIPGGHTGGDVVVFFEKTNVLAIGDIVFAGQFPFIDIDHGGNVERLAEILQEIVDAYPKDAKFVPGHGPVLSRDDLLAYRRMVRETTEVIRKEIARGRSLEEMRTDGILKKWSEWDGSFRQNDWIGFIHESLTESPDPL